MPENRMQRRLGKGFHGKPSLQKTASAIAKGNFTDKKAAKKSSKSNKK